MSTRIEWFDDYGNLHNDNGPAIRQADGYMAWLIHGVFHNESGPSIIFSNGGKEWWLNGKQLTEAAYNSRRSSAGVYIEEHQLCFDF